MIHFEHCDTDGDTLRVETSSYPDAVLIGAEDGNGDGTLVRFFREDVDRLRAALAPHGTNREAPAETGNPAAILDYVDPDGDSLTVYTRTNPAEPLALSATCGEGNGTLTVHLTAEGVTRLREALKPHDPAEAAQPIENGKEYRLLPGALTGAGFASEAVGNEVTRVRVEGYEAWAKAYRVTGLDGRNAGDEGRYLIDPRYLAPLTDPSDAAIAALRARLTEAPAREAYTEPAPSGGLDASLVEALKLARWVAPSATPGDLLVLAAFLVGGLGGVAEMAATAATAGGAQ